MQKDKIHSAVQEKIEHQHFYDSHSHMAGMDNGSPLNDKQETSLAAILLHDYISYLAPSCIFSPQIPTSTSGWQEIEPLINLCRNMSTYTALREGIRALYGFKGDDICAANAKSIDEKIRHTYSTLGERAWQRKVMKKCNVKRQVHICQWQYISEHWKSLPLSELQKQKAILSPSLVIDGFCLTGLAQSRKTLEIIYQNMKKPPVSLIQHEELCEQILDDFIKAGGKSIKLLCAYVRTLEFEDVPTSTAKRLFSKKKTNLPPSDFKKLQDYLVIRLLEMAQKRNLPLLVHTGYSIPTKWGDAENLLTLLQNPRLTGMKIGIVHAGWPAYEKALLLARTFKNCWFDMAWLPLLSPHIAERVLTEAIDILPRNKIMIGTDTGTAESFYGAVMLIRQTLAKTLTAKIREKQFSVAEACNYIEHILWKNPLNFFNENN